MMNNIWSNRLISHIVENDNCAIYALIDGNDHQTKQLAETIGLAGVNPLQAACSTGNLEIVHHFLCNGADPNITVPKRPSPTNSTNFAGHVDFSWCCKGFSPLHISCFTGINAIAEILAENGGDLNQRDVLGRTPLHLVGLNGSASTCSVLTSFGADVNSLDASSRIPLHYACHKGNSVVAKHLMENGSKVNLQDKDGRSPLCLAAKNAHSDVCKLLSQRNAAINLSDYNGWTAMHFASASCDLDTIKLLVNRNGSVDIIDEAGRSPLLLAVECASKHGINKVNFDSHESEPVGVLKRGTESRIGVTKQLIGNENADTLFDRCIEVIETLIRQGANVNRHVTQSGVSPLHVAARGTRSIILQALVANGANVNARDANERTPLHSAASAGHIPNVELLVKFCAKMNAKDSNGMTPLHHAVENHNIGMTKYLLTKNARVNARNTKLQTALHIAAKHNDIETVGILLENGIDTTIKDKHNHAALHYCSTLALVELLQNKLNVCSTDAEGDLTK